MKNAIIIILLCICNISFMGALWHMALNRMMELSGYDRTYGVLKLTPGKGFMLSEYWLVASLILIDIVFVLAIFLKKKESAKQ